MSHYQLENLHSLKIARDELMSKMPPPFPVKKMPRAERIMRQLLSDRLKIAGRITTDDAWQICCKQMGYSTVGANFRHIMAEMVAVGLATKTRSGKYDILSGTEPDPEPAKPIPERKGRPLKDEPMSPTVIPEIPVKQLKPWFSRVYKTMIDV